MVCPVYQQGGSVMKTPHGLAKASQHETALRHDDVFACMLCGACSPYCPQDIDLMQMLVAMRSSFDHQAMIEPMHDGPAYQKAKVIFIADRHLRADEARMRRVMELLGSQHAVLAADHAEDISEAMQKGQPVSHARLHQFLTTLQSVKKIIISDGLLQMLIQGKLPQIPMQSLGHVLSSRQQLRQQITTKDFYVMDSRCYHADYTQLMPYYDVLQQQTGCQLSRDLHRLAIPSGSHATNGFDASAQVQWLLKGRDIDRIIVESVADYDLLATLSEQTVMHVAELLP
jgi:heterodisulfide reductase subunit C